MCTERQADGERERERADKEKDTSGQVQAGKASSVLRCDRSTELSEPDSAKREGEKEGRAEEEGRSRKRRAITPTRCKSELLYGD